MIDMWKDILKIDMEEARRLGDTYSPDDMANPYIVHANKLDEYVKQNIYGLMGELERKSYDQKISEMKNESTNPEHKLKSLLSSLYQYAIPSELRKV